MTPTRVALTAAVVTAAGLGFAAVTVYVVADLLRAQEAQLAPAFPPWMYLAYVLFAALPLATVATAWPLGKGLVLALPLFYLASFGLFVLALVLWVTANREAVLRTSETVPSATTSPAVDPAIFLPLVSKRLAKTPTPEPGAGRQGPKAA
jgi:hypothetical protein